MASETWREAAEAKASAAAAFRSLKDFGRLQQRLNPHQKMVMGWHKAVGQLPHTSQEIQIIIPLEKHVLAVVAAVVEVVILVRQKGGFPAGHGLVPYPGSWGPQTSSLKWR
jgi:hypothetical protein